MNKDPIRPTSSSTPDFIIAIVISILVLYSIVSTGLWMFMLKHNDLDIVLKAIIRNIFI